MMIPMFKETENEDISHHIAFSEKDVKKVSKSCLTIFSPPPQSASFSESAVWILLLRCVQKLICETQ